MVKVSEAADFCPDSGCMTTCLFKQIINRKSNPVKKRNGTFGVTFLLIMRPENAVLTPNTRPNMDCYGKV